MLKSRVDKQIQRHGESITISPGSIAAKAIFQLFDSTRFSTYFDSIEQGSITRPALLAMIGADITVAVGNTITRDSRTYTVKKIHKVRDADTVVVKFLALA